MNFILDACHYWKCKYIVENGESILHRIAKNFYRDVFTVMEFCVLWKNRDEMAKSSQNENRPAIKLD